MKFFSKSLEQPNLSNDKEKKEKKGVSRRDFLKTVAGISTAAVVAPELASAAGKKVLDQIEKEQMPDIKLNYGIKKYGRQEGNLNLETNGNNYSAEYSGIRSSDNFPFAQAPKESGSFEVRDGNIALTEFNFKYDKKEESYTAHYSIKDLPGTDEYIVAREALKYSENGSFVLNSENKRPAFASTDKLPIINFESLIIGISQGKIKENQEMILFESKDNHPKVVIKGEGSQYGCYRKNLPGKPDILLFTIDTNKEGKPSRIKSASRESGWELELEK